MKPAIILNFSLLICFFIVNLSKPIQSEISPMNNGTSKSIAEKSKSTGMTKVNRMKFEIMKITEDLIAYSEYISRRMLGKMIRYQNVCMKLIRDSHKEKLTAISDLITRLHKDDRNMTNCYTSARNKMRQQIIDLERANCNETDMVPINTFVGRINATATWGDQLIDYLDDVIFHCCTKDCTLFHQCVNNKIINAAAHIKKYRQKFKDYREKGVSLKDDHGNFQCFGKRVLDILQRDIESIYRNGTQCVLSYKTGRS